MVPPLLDGDDALVGLPECCTDELDGDVVGHFQTVAVGHAQRVVGGCRVRGGRAAAWREVAQPFGVLVDQHQAVGLVDQDIALLPLEFLKHLVDTVVEVAVIDVERNPVPALLQCEFLYEQVAGLQHDGLLDGAYRAVE